MALHIISVGGSLIVPQGIDSGFLQRFKEFVLARIEQGDRFVLVAGRGRTARTYQDAALAIRAIDDEEKDWLGIHATRLNAHLLRTVFKEQAHPRVIKDYDDDLEEVTKPVLVGAGWKPGWSTDYCCTLLAEYYDADSVINLSNIEYVYSSDPKTDPEAKRFEKVSWKDFRKIVGSSWRPGMSAPFDPIASKKAEASSLKVVILSGDDLANLGPYLNNESFRGTIIS